MSALTDLGLMMQARSANLLAELWQGQDRVRWPARRPRQGGAGRDRLQAADAPFGADDRSYATPTAQLRKQRECAPESRRGLRFRDVGAAPAMAVRSLGAPATMSSSLAIGH